MFALNDVSVPWLCVTCKHFPPGAEWVSESSSHMQTRLCDHRCSCSLSKGEMNIVLSLLIFQRLEQRGIARM